MFIYTHIQQLPICLVLLYLPHFLTGIHPEADAPSYPEVERAEG